MKLILRFSVGRSRLPRLLALSLFVNNRLILAAHDRIGDLGDLSPYIPPFSDWIDRSWIDTHTRTLTCICTRDYSQCRSRHLLVSPPSKRRPTTRALLPAFANNCTPRIAPRSAIRMPLSGRANARRTPILLFRGKIARESERFAATLFFRV